MQTNCHATWVPCTAHSLNLVGQNGAECCMSAVKFFDFLEKVSLQKRKLHTGGGPKKVAPYEDRVFRP